MMQIDKVQPNLDDVLDGIKEVFFSFGVKAVRSDEIGSNGVKSTFDPCSKLRVKWGQVYFRVKWGQVYF